MSDYPTPWGLATEPSTSPKYEADGHWRGPVWAPPTLLIADGRARIGEQRLAREIARRFCRSCVARGFVENFDALTGAGLRDRAYTWTASVFLVPAHEILEAP
jgi:putative isomerase